MKNLQNISQILLSIIFLFLAISCQGVISFDTQDFSQHQNPSLEFDEIDEEGQPPPDQLPENHTFTFRAYRGENSLSYRSIRIEDPHNSDSNDLLSAYSIDLTHENEDVSLGNIEIQAIPDKPDEIPYIYKWLVRENIWDSFSVYQEDQNNSFQFVLPEVRDSQNPYEIKVVITFDTQQGEPEGVFRSYRTFVFHDYQQ